MLCRPQLTQQGHAVPFMLDVCHTFTHSEVKWHKAPDGSTIGLGPKKESPSNVGLLGANLRRRGTNMLGFSTSHHNRVAGM